MSHNHAFLRCDKVVPAEAGLLAVTLGCAADPDHLQREPSQASEAAFPERRQHLKVAAETFAPDWIEDQIYAAPSRYP